MIGSSGRLPSRGRSEHDSSGTDRAPDARPGRPTGLTRLGEHGTGRDLKTARAVLQVLRLLESRGQVDTAEVAQALGKSHATATYLLNSLVAEGFAERELGGALRRYRLVDRAPPGSEVGPPFVGIPSPAVQRALEGALAELYARTGERSYLAFFDQDRLVVADSIGRQGLPRIPGLGPTVRAEAHCLAVGKVVLAELGLSEWTRRVGLDTLPRFTPASIVDPDALEEELQTARSSSFALDAEEFAPAICCVAAPVRDDEGILVGVLGVSVPASRFRATQDRLVESVRDICSRAGTGPARNTPERHQEPNNCRGG